MKRESNWLAGVIAPLAFIVAILIADTLEGPKTAFVGVLAVVPMFSAVFGTPLMTASVGLITLASGFLFGLTASDGNVAAQNVRLVIIALVGVVALIAAVTRQRLQRQLTEALLAAEQSRLAERQARTDAMTGLLNRRGLIHALDEFDSSMRSVAILDCDQLKAVNDTHGHLVGDEYITAIAGRLSHGLARRDLIARWGGDEFIVVMAAPLPQAQQIMDRLMARVSDAPISTVAGPLGATVSAGVAEWPPGVEFDSILRIVDRALYDAKNEGRGKLVAAAAVR